MMDCERSSENWFPIVKSHSATTFQQFLQTLKEHEMATRSKFVFVKRTKKFLDVQDALSISKLRMHWQEDIPYYNLGSIIYACHQGKDYGISTKKKYAKNRESMANTDHVYINRYRKVRKTKKLDCPVKIIVTKALRFTNYKLTGEITKRKKVVCSETIKTAIEGVTDLGEECYIFNLPKEEDHKNHLCDIVFSKPSTSTIEFQQESKKCQLINKMNSTISLIQSFMGNLNENELQKGNELLETLLKMMTSKDFSDSRQAPVQENKNSCKYIRGKDHGTLTVKRKRVYSGGVEMTVDLKEGQTILVVEEDHSTLSGHGSRSSQRK